MRATRARECTSRGNGNYDTRGYVNQRAVFVALSSPFRRTWEEGGGHFVKSDYAARAFRRYSDTKGGMERRQGIKLKRSYEGRRRRRRRKGGIRGEEDEEEEEKKP